VSLCVLVAVVVFFCFFENRCNFTEVCSSCVLLICSALPTHCAPLSVFFPAYLRISPSLQLSKSLFISFICCTPLPMSSDPAINAALLNMCAQVQDRGNNTQAAAGTTSTGGAQPSSTLASAPSTAAAVSGSGSADATSSGTASARPASDYEWLRNALASVESPEKKVKQLLFQMEDKMADGKAGPIDPEDRLEALEELSDMVEDVNWAAEFTLMEGPQRVLRVLRRERAAHPLTTVTDPVAPPAGEEVEGETGPVTFASIPLYTQFAMIIAHSSQLNEPVQAVYHAAHWEDVVLRLVRDTVKALQTLGVNATAERDDDVTEESASTTATKLMKLLAALLHACSCLCRECPANSIQFLQQGGLAALAEVLKLTQSTLTSVHSGVPAGDVPVAVTTIHEGLSDKAEETDKVDYGPLISSSNKVTSRTFFFAAYLASTGVSSEDIIQLTCQHAEANEDVTVQKAAARVLLELVAKSPKVIKEAVHAHMPKRFYQWRLQLQHVVGDDHEGGRDERQLFVQALDSSN
jgi:hypothetical protein